MGAICAHIAAWGPCGHAWDTDQLVYDDLEVVSVTEHALTATGSWPPGTTRRLNMDLRTGNQTR